MKVLVKEPIAASGVELLRREFDVELGVDWPAEDLSERIGEFDAMIVRSATKLTADLIGRAQRLKVIGRAGTGVDNVDVEAATRRGIVVVNAPESNSIAAAEHTLAVLLALCRNVPQAHASLTGGEWARSRFAGAELYGKTIGVIGFGRIGQLVAKRAQSFEMEVLAFDKFVAPERFRELGVEGVETTDELYGRADFITIHLPKTPETVNWLDAEALAKMRDGVRIVNCARGELVDLEALEAGLESGKVAGAALDVFPTEPLTEHPLFDRDDVVVTPHLGASTAEAQDRAGTVTAEQVAAALNGGVVTNAVNIAAVRPEEMEALAPFVPLCQMLGRLAQGLGTGSVERVRAEFRGRIAEHDTRLLGIAVLVGILSGHTEEQVNLVNAAAMAEERGIDLSELSDTASEDFTELVSVRVEASGDAVEVAGTAVGPRNIPYLAGVWGQSFYIPLAEHLAVFRYRDQPGMIGRVGTAFGAHGVNIVSAAVGAEASREGAVMALTTDAAVPPEVIDEIASGDGFFAGRAVDLSGRPRVRAVVITRHGPPEVLRVEERPDPQAGPGDVRVAVRAAGINFADTMARAGTYPDAPRPPCVVGYEVAGEVESVGERVEGLSVGDRVLAGTRFGGYAELVSVPAGQAVPLHDSVSFEEGAAFPINYGTAYAALVIMAGLKEGERALIHAAAGGVGIAATQIAKIRGAEIFGTASAAKHEAIRAQGVDHPIDYRSTDFADEVMRITGGEGVDVIIDAVGPSSFRKDYRILRQGGRLVMYGASEIQTGERRDLRAVAKALTAMPVATMPWWKSAAMMNENKGVFGLNMLSWWDREGSIDRMIEPLRSGLEAGELRPVVAEAFPFDRAAEAHRFIAERRNVGKVVLVP